MSGSLAARDADQAMTEHGGTTDRRPGRQLDALRAGTTKSLNVALVEQLRTDVMQGRIAPGIKLKIPDICAQYGVSPGVAREALSRLVPEGLIDFADQRGFRTPPITAEGVRDLTRVRLLIEREAIIDAIRNGDDSWEAGIVAAQHRLLSKQKSANPDQAEIDDWALRHRLFHMALISACTSPWLIRLHNMLYDQTERFRFIAAKAGNQATGQTRNTSDEHTRLAAAVIARDEETAARLVEEHLQQTANRALAAAQTAPPLNKL